MCSSSGTSLPQKRPKVLGMSVPAQARPSLFSLAHHLPCVNVPPWWLGCVFPETGVRLCSGEQGLPSALPTFSLCPLPSSASTSLPPYDKQHRYCRAGCSLGTSCVSQIHSCVSRLGFITLRRFGESQSQQQWVSAKSSSSNTVPGEKWAVTLALAYVCPF